MQINEAMVLLLTDRTVFHISAQLRFFGDAVKDVSHENLFWATFVSDNNNTPCDTSLTVPFLRLTTI